jgi:DNA-binding XRE family transcriptional regulator
MKSHKEFKPALQKLGEKSYHRRVLKNYTTKGIAPMLSLTPEAYRNIEKGESDPSFTTFLQITKVLEIDHCELMNSLQLEEILEV